VVKVHILAKLDGTYVTLHQSSIPANKNTRFNYLHSEQLPTAISRYNNEVRRILGVLEGALEGKQWLIGNKCTFADLSFAPWNDRVDTLLMVSAEQKFEDFPNTKAWHERITARPSWKKAMKTRAKLMDDQGLQWNGMPKGVNNMQEYKEMVKKHAEEIEKEEEA
jgi:glutathione S-transferase